MPYVHPIVRRNTVLLWFRGKATLKADNVKFWYLIIYIYIYIYQRHFVSLDSIRNACWHVGTYHHNTQFSDSKLILKLLSLFRINNKGVNKSMKIGTFRTIGYRDNVFIVYRWCLSSSRRSVPTGLHSHLCSSSLCSYMVPRVSQRLPRQGLLHRTNIRITFVGLEVVMNVAS
jgi:hypothetical protein